MLGETKSFCKVCSRVLLFEVLLKNQRRETLLKLVWGWETKVIRDREIEAPSGVRCPAERAVHLELTNGIVVQRGKADLEPTRANNTDCPRIKRK